MEENDCIAMEKGQTLSLDFFAFVDFVGSIIVVIVGEHIVTDMGLIIDRPIDR